MLRLALVLLLAILLALPSVAATCAPVLYLWRVKAPHAAKADYLVGTIHMSWPKGANLPTEAGQALARSNHFVTEADYKQATRDLIARFAWLPQDQSNARRFTKALWHTVAQEAQKAGYTPALADRMAPWFLVAILANPADDPWQIPDTLLRQAADRMGLSVGFLEAAQDQFQLLATFSAQYYDEQLVNLAGIRAYHQQMADVYGRGDLNTLAAITIPAAAARKHPAIYERLFFARNDRWLPQIERAIAERDAFIAVGIGHLLGERGLLAQLKAKGYTIEQVTPVCPGR